MLWYGKFNTNNVHIYIVKNIKIIIGDTNFRSI